MEDVSVIISTNFAASCFQVPSSTSLTPADISSGWSSRQTSYGYRNASWTVSEHWNSSQLQHPFTVHVVLLSSGKAYSLLNLNLFCIHLPVALPVAIVRLCLISEPLWACTWHWHSNFLVFYWLEWPQSVVICVRLWPFFWPKRIFVPFPLRSESLGSIIIYCKMLKIKNWELSPYL